MTRASEVAARDWDYVVVGAGSAGATLASRLTEDPSCRVLLVEAGADWRSAEATAALRGSDGLALMDAVAYPDYQWVGLSARRTTMQSPAPFVRGRGVGGSSIINGQAAIRPPLEEFETWVVMGCVGWGPADVLPGFVRLETDLDFGDQDYHGSSGPLPLSRPSLGAVGSFDAAFFEAAQSMGFDWCPDHNAPGAQGISPFAWNAKDGARVTVNDAYLEPARHRPNLAVLGGVLVDRVEFHGQRAIGIRARVDGEWMVIGGGEIVLSAGPVGSPAILQRSGIGPSELLLSVGVPLVTALPTGQNLQDHPIVPIWVGLADEPLAAGQRHMNGVLRYTSRGPDGVLGDLQTNVMRSPSQPALGGMFVHVNRCTSRGSLAISGPDPEGLPFIEEHMLETPEDLALMRQALRDAGTLFASEALGRVVLEASAAEPLLASTGTPDAELDAIARYVTLDSAHICGTCRMGSPDDVTTVVDPDCRVLGTEHLLVIDLSVVPTVPRANTHLTAVMIAETMATRLRRAPS